MSRQKGTSATLLFLNFSSVKDPKERTKEKEREVFSPRYLSLSYLVSILLVTSSGIFLYYVFNARCTHGENIYKMFIKSPSGFQKLVLKLRHLRHDNIVGVTHIECLSSLYCFFLWLVDIENIFFPSRLLKGQNPRDTKIKPYRPKEKDVPLYPWFLKRQSLNSGWWLITVKPIALGLVVMEVQLECPFWVRVVLATFPPIIIRVRKKGLVGISLAYRLGSPRI